MSINQKPDKLEDVHIKDFELTPIKNLDNLRTNSEEKEMHMHFNILKSLETLCEEKS